MKQTLTIGLFATFLLSALPVAAQIPGEITTAGTCRCAVAPSTATLAVSSIAVEHVTDHVLIAFNQPVEVKNPLPIPPGGPAVTVGGFKFWVDGQLVSSDSLSVNPGEMDLSIRARLVNASGVKINLLPTSNVEVEYTPQVGNLVTAKFNSSLTLGAILKKKVIEGTVNDVTCPTPLDYRMNGYGGGQDGSVFTFPVTEPLAFNLGGSPLEVTVNNVKSTGSGTAIGVTAGALSIQNLWPSFKDTDVITINPGVTGGGFKDLNGNKMCASPVTLRPLNSAFTSTTPPQPVKPEVLGFTIDSTTKAFTSTGTTANRKIPTFIMNLNVPVTPTSLAYLRTSNGLWIKFTPNTTNPYQMTGKDAFGQTQFQAHHKGTLDIVSILMLNVTSQDGEKLTYEAVQNAIKNNNVSKNGTVFVAIENYEALSRKAARKNRAQ